MKHAMSVFLDGAVRVLRGLEGFNVLSLNRGTLMIGSQNPNTNSLIAEVVRSGKRESRDFLWFWKSGSGSKRNWLGLISMKPSRQIIVFDEKTKDDIMEFAEKYHFDVKVGKMDKVDVDDVVETGIF